MQITQRHSPNFNSRHGATPRMLVMHASVGAFTSALNWLTSAASKVSSHYLIGKTGVVYQLVSDADAAWHAGDSAWLGLDSQAIQDVSIGIELANQNDGIDPYPAAQLAAATELGRLLIARYQIDPRMVVRHLDIAPGRKTDPAGFPWAAFKAALYASEWPRDYRAISCAPVYQTRAPDGVLAGTFPAGAIVRMDQLQAGYLHDQAGLGFTPVACWEPT